MPDVQVAVAMSPKPWVVVSGGLLGIVALRLVVGRLLVIIQKYPALVDGAFIIIAWVGVKLIMESLHTIGLLQFEIPRWLSIGLIVLILLIALAYARRHGQHDITGQAFEGEATEPLEPGSDEASRRSD